MVADLPEGEEEELPFFNGEDAAVEDVDTDSEELAPEDEVELDAEAEVESDPEAIAPIDTSDREFYTGTFTVGETGEVGVDYLFDGGSYKGELAIFS
ncbi:MAG: hypothetical protein HC925_03625, partial [Coleofasciculaceae cyanobacterium SM2_3_26]|nr:hypothetical protein [Coleofasciculaceae cyanobacterium SM2_3_26]